MPALEKYLTLREKLIELIAAGFSSRSSKFCQVHCSIVFWWRVMSGAEKDVANQQRVLDDGP